MKTLKITLIWTIIVFIALTLLTMKNDAAEDGFNTYGFPFTYYVTFGGKCKDCYNQLGFKPFYFMLDILGSIALGLLITIFKRRL